MSGKPCILLLGEAGAGKTALLEALARAEPTHQGGTKVIECAGKEAQEYLAGKRLLNDGTPLARSIKTADALVLAVPPAEEKQFEQRLDAIEGFFNSLQSDRGLSSEIAGLPVYLVLTKGDLLSRTGDTAAAWIERLEESKHQLAQRFHIFLERTNLVPFGQIALHVWATAIKRPAFADRPARAQEPYGVAELFRQVLPAARAFSQTRIRAQRRLRGFVAGLLLLSGVMATVVTGFSLFRPSAAEAALESEVGAAVAAPAADRLRDPVGARIKEWAALLENPAFAQLPAGLKRAVASAAQEAATYQELLKKVDSLKRVRFFRNDDDIIFYKKAVDKIVVPAQYAADWMTTRLAKRLVQYRSELEAVATALALEKDWLTSQQAIGDKLLRMAIPGAGTPQRQEWINNADVFLRGKDLTKPVPHVTNMKLKELYDFPSLRGWRADYQSTRARVAKIRGGLTNS